MKRISIITASYNDAAGLNALATNLRQEKRELFQWIVVDGASSDHTQAIAQSHKDLIDVFISEPDQGVYDAWNKGLVHAHGQWIIFLGCDDRLGCGWLEEVVNVPQENDLVYGDLILLSQDHQKHRIKTFSNWAQAQALLPHRMCLPHSGMAHHRRLFAENRFDPSYRICGDWDFLLRACPKSGVHIPNQIQTVMSLGGLSSSAQSELRMYREICRIQKARNISIAVGWKLKFYIRMGLSWIPGLYNWVQQLGMKPWAGIA